MRHPGNSVIPTLSGIRVPISLKKYHVIFLEKSTTRLRHFSGSFDVDQTATPSAGYKIADATKLKLTGTSGGNGATFNVGTFTIDNADGTATATATITGTDITDTMSVANATESGATASITNKVLVAGAGGLTVEYSTTGGDDYDSTNPTDSGWETNGVDDLYIKLTAPAGKVFVGDVDFAVSEANMRPTFAKSDVSKDPSDTTGLSFVVFKIPSEKFEVNGIQDLATMIRQINIKWIHMRSR